MPDLPKKKVGIVACSGEELAEGTVTRLAALKVLEHLRPQETVTICLPLFLAGGEGDRAFARFYPTIAIDGCDKRCAARATEMHSGKPAAGIVVTDLIAGDSLGTARQLNAAGYRALETVAGQIAQTVDELLDLKWDRRRGQTSQVSQTSEVSEAAVAACACGSGIPVQKVQVNGQAVTLIALPAIFDQFHAAGKPPEDGTVAELMQTVKLYNPIPKDQEANYAEVILRAYRAFYEEQN
jgi:uncharacterized metal-binding protein